MRPIRVFLGGYINSTNAQNLNCLALAKHLDKQRFQAGALYLYSGNLSVDNNILKSVRLFRAFRPHRYSRYFAYFLGILWADIIYLPKEEICKWNKFWIKLLGKKSFKTVEGIYGEEMLDQILQSGMSYEDFKKSFEGYDKLFSITKFLKEYNETHHGIRSEDKILYLGTDTHVFLNKHRQIEQLKNIVFIGRLKKRKGVYDILTLAKEFPQLNFFLAGDGEEKNNIEKMIFAENLDNVELLGILSHEKLSILLTKMDLHIFPSRSEGFPKVTLETAAAGVPSVVYPNYGADEWIDNGKNGFIVKNVIETKELLEKLLKNPEKLRDISKNATELAERFDWKNVVKDWEKVIEKLYKR